MFFSCLLPKLHTYSDVEAVVMGFDGNLTYLKLMIAASYINSNPQIQEYFYPKLLTVNICIIT